MGYAIKSHHLLFAAIFYDQTIDPMGTWLNILVNVIDYYVRPCFIGEAVCSDVVRYLVWWRHVIELPFALLALCEGTTGGRWMPLTKGQ